jgi:hypothetical protein
VNTTLSVADFRAWVRACREMFPTRYPVKARRRKLADCGWAQVCGAGDGTHYQITISSALDRQSTSDTLLHEWAHIITGEETGDYESHGLAFWERHGEIYRAWHRTT